ncbi:hypothetical protein TWF173_000732 [Orbilia oligospora]|nr:hypothetical protein TWF173_000732 [Orbilia oligospora]
MGRTTLADASQGCALEPGPPPRPQSAYAKLEAWFNVLAHYSSRNTQKSITGQYKRSRPSCQHKRKEWGVSIDPTNWILKLLVESEVIFSPPSRNRGRTPLSRSRSVNVSFDDLHVSIF